MSQHSIFTKSNLVYIPLSITLAHILNFVINSPLSTWQEFPPKLPSSVYSSIFFTPLLLFTSLTFEPIQTRKHFYTLLSIALIFSSIPISFRGGKYPPSLHGLFVSFGSMYGLKMLLFLKFNRAYLKNQNNPDRKEFNPFLWTLFNWRFDSYIIPPKSKSSGEKENSLIIKSPTTSQINEKLINRIIIFTAKWLIYELSLFILVSTKHAVEIPEKAYQIRLVELITNGAPAVTKFLMLQYSTFLVFAYFCLSLNYDFITIVITFTFRLFFHPTSEQSNYKSILVRSGLLTPSEYASLYEWFATFIFNTKHFFSEPWMASSPRDFWSTRWQSTLNEIFKELGYSPVRNLFAPFVSRKVANMMGVLGAFGVSALLHEYLIIGNHDIWTGEQFFFFMIHGVILIIWEGIFGYENKNANVKITRFLKWILLAVIYLPTLPAFAEPLMRRFRFHEIPSYFAKNYMI